VLLQPQRAIDAPRKGLESARRSALLQLTDAEQRLFASVGNLGPVRGWNAVMAAGGVRRCGLPLWEAAPLASNHVLGSRWRLSQASSGQKTLTHWSERNRSPRRIARLPRMAIPDESIHPRL